MSTLKLALVVHLAKTKVPVHTHVALWSTHRNEEEEDQWATYIVRIYRRTLQEFYTLKVPKNYILRALKTKSYHSLYLPSTWKDKQIISKKSTPKKKNAELSELLQVAIFFLHNVPSAKKLGYKVR